MKTIISFIILCFSVLAFAEEPNSVSEKYYINFASNKANQQQAKAGRVAVSVVHLTPGMQQFLSSRLSLLNNNLQTTASDLPPAVNLGMSAMPILDQGDNSTCVTFATTAALDAALGKGDYISQLCLLELLNYLHQNDYTHNPWDDSTSSIIIHGIEEFGIINKQVQRSGVCGLKHYSDGGDNDILAPDVYHRPYSEDIFGTSLKTGPKLGARTLFNLPDNYYGNDPLTPANDPNSYVTPDEALQLVKKALSQGQRVIIGMLIDFNSGGGLWAGKHLDTMDTWMLTDSIKRDLTIMLDGWGGHEIILYGYDDNAVARAQDGKTQQGLFFVRNSWGDHKFPNKGIEFMTYDYFKALATEAVSIIAYK